MFSKLLNKLIESDNIDEIPSTNVNIAVEQDISPNVNDINSQINWLIHNGWTDKYNPSKKTLLIMDDREAIISSIMDDLYSLDEQEPNFSISNYNILKIHSKMAGFFVFDILEKAPLIEINFALLDIILGGKKVIDDKRKMVDGVDVALEIWENFESAEILFFSGCIIESDGKDIFNFKDKFENYTGDLIDSYILPKDSSFEDELEKLTEFFSGIPSK